MDSFPILHSSRLLLRKIDPDDIPSLVKYANNKKISDFVLNIPYPYNEPDAVFRISYVVQGFKNKARYIFAIILKENDEFIGEISLHLDRQQNISELGYWIAEPFWNQGLAGEAAAAVLKFGFEKLELNLIFATCTTENIASQKVAAKAGMQRGKTTGNVIQFVITGEDYAASKTNSNFA
jgi:[ribosomal protein S5]-alanine N-acetyltransferase